MRLTRQQLGQPKTAARGRAVFRGTGNPPVRSQANGVCHTLVVPNGRALPDDRAVVGRDRARPLRSRPAIGRRGARPLRAFSLFETMIGVSILGIGLIMLAALFPVALSEHRLSVERAEALDMLSKAETLLHKRLDPDLLWFDPVVLGNGLDSPWYLAPFANIDVNGMWALDLPGSPGSMDFADALNGASIGFSELQFGMLGPFGADILSDRVVPMPFNDARSKAAPHRSIAYGFYRRLANGATEFAAAVCRQRRNDVFFRQDLSAAFPFDNPTADVSRPQRFPTPWRVNVARFPQSQFIYGGSASIPLPQLAQPGTKIMIRGNNSAGFQFAASGRILTVADPVDLDANGVTEGVQVFEDITDIFADDPANAADGNFRFDVWLFPPAVAGNNFGDGSPLVEWKVAL